MLDRIHLPAWLICVGAGLAASLLYLLLLTQQYSGDGLRWYAMISGAAPLQSGGTNHLLYPALARLYFYLAHNIIGLPAIFATAQSLNAWFGGAGVACLAYILFRFIQRWSLTLAGAFTLALARAYAQHAADMTEPMAGLFFALLALVFMVMYVISPHPRRWLVMAAGLSIGVGASIYQSNVLALVGVVAILFLNQTTPYPRRLQDLLLCIAIAGLVALGVYITTFLLFGEAQTLSEAFWRALHTENEATQGIYAELSLRRVGVLIFGWGDTLFGLRAIGGQSNLFFARGLTLETGLTAGLVGWSVAVVALIAAPYIFGYLRLSNQSRRWVWAGTIGLLPLLFLLVYWGARYSKLWLLPLALSLLVVVILVNESFGQKSRLAYVTRLAFWGGLATPVFAVGLLNLTVDHFMPNPGMQDTLDIAARLSNRDLLVSEWGGTPYIVPANPHSFGLVAAAFAAKLEPLEVLVQLEREMEAARQRGGSVYFYGLFDLPETEWNVSLGSRLQMPYTVLDTYRPRVTPVMTLRLRTSFDTPLHLWQLTP